MVQLMPLLPDHLLHHVNPRWIKLSGANLPVLEKRPLNGCLSTAVTVTVSHLTVDTVQPAASCPVL